jgi:hypothetical protein
MRQCDLGMRNGHAFPAASAAFSASRHYPKWRQTSFYRAAQSPHLEPVLRCSSGNRCVSGSHPNQLATGKATTRYIGKTKITDKDCLFDGAEARGMQCKLGRAQSSLSPGIRPYPTKPGLILASPLLGGGGILKSKTLTPQRCLPSYVRPSLDPTMTRLFVRFSRPK